MMVSAVRCARQWLVLSAALAAGCTDAPVPDDGCIDGGIDGGINSASDRNDAAAPSATTPENESEVLQIARSFLSDRAFRRRALIDSLLDRNNGYARERLEHYGLDPMTTKSSWESLPEQRVLSNELRESPAQADADPQRFELSEPLSEATLLELGRAAFEGWPSQSFSELRAVLGDSDPKLANRLYGLWTDADGWLGGVVEATYDSGAKDYALTCASCHARPGPDGSLIHGPASDIDLGWGPGKIDVTADDWDNPVAIADLRATVHQTRLHWTGNLKNGLAALAVRIETLLITSAGNRVRPPREVVMGLTLYVQSLGRLEARSNPSNDAFDGPGAALFAQHCALCHSGPTGAGDWVAIEAVGMDAAAALSPSRGTRGYRVPSLHDTASRSRLLHIAFEGGLDDLLNPERLDSVAGHPFGTDLNPTDRAALADFVGGL